MKSSTLLALLIGTLLSFSNSWAQYCTSSGSAGSGAYIGQSCFNFPSCESSNGPGSYSDRTGEGSKATFTPTGPNPMLGGVERSSAGDYTYAFYIDLNGDGDFVDAGETITAGSGNISFASGGLASINTNVTIPATATNGTTRVRLIAKDGSTPVSGPCETGFNGETEDFLVTIAGAGGGCTMTASITSQTNISCTGANTGSITVSVNNGSANYDYVWSNGSSTTNTSSTTSTILALAAGNYTVTITDDNGCTAMASTTLTEPSAALVSDFSSNMQTVCENTTVDFTSNASGGTTPYSSYNWNFGDGSTSTEQNPSHTYTTSGNYTVSLTVTDDNGCTDTETKNAYIQVGSVGSLNAAFTANPLSGCTTPHTVFFTDQSTAATSWLWEFGNGNTSTAQNPIHTYTSSGTFTVTLTARNASGCSDSTSQTVRISSPINASIASQTNNDCIGDSNGTATVSTTGGTAPLTYSWSPSGGNNATATGLAAGTYTVTVTDDLGCTDTATVTITDTDNIPPVANCVGSYTAQLDANGQATIAVTDIDSGSTDNCEIASMVLDRTAFSCSDVGNNTVTLTVTDTSGNTDSCTATVVVEDTIDPTITCSADIVVDNDSSICGAIVTFSNPTVSDNCSAGGMVSQTFNFMGAEETFVVPAGVTSLRAMVYGAQGGANWANNDNFGGLVEADIPVTPGETLYIYVGEQPIGLLGGWNGGGNGETNGAGGGGASDIRRGGNTLANRIIVAGAGGGAGFWSGQHVKGGAGGDLIGQAGYRDTPANPGGEPGTQTGSGNGTCVSLNNPAVSGGLGFGGTPAGCGCEGYGGGAGYYGGAGSGNCRGGGGGSSFTEASLTNVVHSQGVQTGHGRIVLSYVSTLAPVQTVGLASGSEFPVGTTTNTFEVTDANGNTATCSFTVTVNDTENPEIVCPSNVEVNNDPAICGAVVTYTEPVGTDNCFATTTQTDGTGLSSGDAFPVGVTTLEYTATDASGNTAVCSFTVTVNDTEVPNAVCQDITVQLNASGTATITANDVDGGSTDNCGVNNLSIDTDTFDCSQLGTNTVTLTVVDVSGNTSSCTATVTVEDSTTPIIACPTDIMASANTGACGTTVNFAQPLVIDNCSTTTVTQTAGPTSGSFFPVGDTTVAFTATDAGGNTVTCSFMVTVTDDELPVATCQDITVQLDAMGVATIAPSDIDAGATDNCGVDTVTIDVTDFDCSDVGANTVTLSVTDVNGNVATCTATVTVEDSIAPVATCQDVTIALDASGMATITAIDIDNGSTDNCGVYAISLDNSTFDCSHLGTNSVTMTVTDANGNTSTCMATVTVVDDLAPVLACQVTDISLDENGTATIDPYELLDPAVMADNCGIDVITADVTTVDCMDIGTPISVTLFATDASGNVSSCNTTVNVVDTLAPEVTCPADQEKPADAATFTYTLEDFIASGEAFATDNCTDPVAIISQSPASGTQLGVGAHSVTITAEDEYGNVSNCTFTIEVTVPLGMEENEQLATVQLYPNPAREMLHIANPRGLKLKSVQVYDLGGRVVITRKLDNTMKKEMLHVSQLASATYMVVIKTESGTLVKRIVKE